MRLLILFCLCCITSSASGEIFIYTETGRIQSVDGRYLSYFEDPDKILDASQVTGRAFIPADFTQLNFGFANSSFWLHFVIYNPYHTSANVMLQVKNPNLDVVSLTSRHKGSQQTLSTGDYFEFSHRPVQSKYFLFPLTLPPLDTVHLYLNVQNSGEQLFAPVFIGPPQAFHTSEQQEQIYFGIYFGIIVFAILINLFFSLVLREPSTLFYIGYLTGLLLLQLSLTGLGFQYLWPGSVYWANHANPVFANFSVLCLIFFASHFLKLKTYLPLAARWFRVTGYLMALSAALGLFAVPVLFMTSVYVVNAVTLLLNVLILPVAIYVYRKHYYPARFFIIAFVVLIISVFLFIFRNLGLLPAGFITDYGIQIGSGLEVLLLTLAVIDRFRQFKDEALQRLEEVNRLKTESNIRLEARVAERTEEIIKQKVEIEEKNVEILSSIRYARRIQEAILPATNSAQLPHFILYLPRDIVSGDFYWYHQQDNLLYFAVADCTGHGVPGAFMSILGSNYLRQSVQDLKKPEPAAILDYVNRHVITTLNQEKQEDRVRDGMDISLVKINLENRALSFSGANNPLYLFRNGELTILPADKVAIGSVADSVHAFSNCQHQLQAGDMLYLFTDGYADQFGGPQGKKYKYKNLKLLLTDIAGLPLLQQAEMLENTFYRWKGDLEQVDDVCITGINIQ